MTISTCKNDYAHRFAATGIRATKDGSPYLDGTGSVLVFTAAQSVRVRSITVKAIAPVQAGMVRLFISRGAGPLALYREVPVPAHPEAAVVPLPTPKYLMFETVLEGELLLNTGDKIYASTQNAGAFNIIVEAVSWNYKETLPPDCCSFAQGTANTGVAQISVANPDRNGSGAIVSIFNAGAGLCGAFVRSITIKALASTHEGVVRIFIGSGNKLVLMREVWIPQTAQSSFDPSFKQVIDMNFYLQHGLILGASTENAESFAITVEGVNLSYPI